MGYRYIVFLLVPLLPTGCADVISLLSLFDDKKPVTMRFYCEPDRVVEILSTQHVEESDASDWNKVCGWKGVEFVSATDKRYPPGRYNHLYIYKTVLHSVGHEDVVVKDTLIPEDYVVLGEFHFPERWYHMKTVEDYIRRITGKLGGNAVSEFHVYTDRAGSEAIEPMPTASVMRIDATVIRYLETE